MAVDFAPLVAPASTAVLVLEMQNGLAGPEAGQTPISAAVAEQATVVRCAEVLAAARSAGARVVHCIKHERADGLGASANTPMWRRRATVGFVPLTPGSRAAAVVDGLSVEDSDLLCARSRGVTAFGGTELDPLLRNLGIQTVVLVGMSVNVGIIAAAADAVSCGYEVVIVRDAVAGTPRSYVDDVFKYTLAPIAVLTDVASLARAWEQNQPA